MPSEEFFFDFTPKYLGLPKAVAEILNEVIFDNLNELNKLDEIDGLTIIRYDGKQPLIFTPDESRFSYLKTLGEIISSLDPSSYFKDLSKNFEFKGIGHLSFDDFDLFLAKIAKNLLLAIMANDPSSRLFRVVQKFGDELCEIFYQYERFVKGEEFDTTTENSMEREVDNYVPSFQESETSTKYLEKKTPKNKTPSKDQLKDSLREKLNKMKEL